MIKYYSFIIICKQRNDKGKLYVVSELKNLKLKNGLYFKKNTWNFLIHENISQIVNDTIEIYFDNIYKRTNKK